MPLRDHFRPPLDLKTSWEGFHGRWPAMIVMALNRKLPPGYAAEPRVPLGASMEIDVSNARTTVGSFATSVAMAGRAAAMTSRAVATR